MYNLNKSFYYIPIIFFVYAELCVQEFMGNVIPISAHLHLVFYNIAIHF